MQTVMIGSQPYDSYASVAQADQYLAASVHAGTTWEDATDTLKGQALTTATRILDRQRWVSAYDTQAKREGVQQISDACVEMALALLGGSDLQTEQVTGQKLQSIRAGSVSLSYFRGADGRPHRFPTIINELLRDYLTGGASELGGVATGVDGASSTGDDFGFTGGV